MKALWTAFLAFSLALAPSFDLAAGGGLDLTIEGLVWAVIYLIIAACIIGLLYYLVVVLIGPLLPPPFARWVRIAFLILVVLFAIVFLLHLLGRIH